jgi:hypothetical protein
LCLLGIRNLFVLDCMFICVIFLFFLFYFVLFCFVLLYFILFIYCILFHFILFFFVISRPNGNTFTVPANDVHIPTPQIGEIVTFSYERRSYLDSPINPKIVKVRNDILWRDVMLNSHKEKKYLNRM